MVKIKGLGKGKKDICTKGQSCGVACIEKVDFCGGILSTQISKKLKRLNTQPNTWEKAGEGAYGVVYIDVRRKLAKKINKPIQDKKASIYEFEVAKLMGEKGHSPKVYPELSTENSITMDLVPGKPIWKNYWGEDDEPEFMSEAQSKRVIEAIMELHREGYYHGDLHVGNILVKGDDAKVIDYGKAGKLNRLTSPKAMADWGKTTYLGLDRFKDDPKYAELISLIAEYKAIGGSQSKVAKEKRANIANKYLLWLTTANS